jgi:hypothetical protein
LGYSADSPIERRVISMEGADISFPIDPEVPLQATASFVPQGPTRQVPFAFNWVMVDGIPIDQRSAGMNHVLPKSIERPSLFSAQLAPPGFDGHRFYSDKSDQQTTLRDQISPELRDYFGSMIDLFDADSDESLDALSAALTGDAGIQPLLPLLLQFMAGRLTLNLRDTSTVRKVALLGLALVNNMSLPIHFFVHALVRTAMTVLLRYETGPSIDEDIEVRHISANFLYEICVRCASGFPTIAAVAQNALIAAWLNPQATHPSQLGAFIGICRFGRQAVVRLLPHIRGYLRPIKRELALGNPAKGPIIATVLVDLRQLLESQLQEMKEQPKWESLIAEITALVASCECE